MSRIDMTLVSKAWADISHALFAPELVYYNALVCFLFSPLLFTRTIPIQRQNTAKKTIEQSEDCSGRHHTEDFP
jgi:hypothetical protein